MKITILGTGGVGQTLAGKLAQLGHAVTVATRSPEATLARTGPDSMGTPAFKDWHAKNPKVTLVPLPGSLEGADLVVNATVGHGSVETLKAAGASALRPTILLDIANPLDFSQGFPPSLSVCNTDSLGEQIQHAFPNLRVVKSLNCVSAVVMINPQSVPSGQPSMFVSGNDPEAKAQVTQLLKNDFGWQDVIDLGDITTSRGTEMILPLWVRTFSVLQTPNFGLKVVR